MQISFQLDVKMLKSFFIQADFEMHLQDFGRPN